MTAKLGGLCHLVRWTSRAYKEHVWWMLLSLFPTLLPTLNTVFLDFPVSIRNVAKTDRELSTVFKKGTFVPALPPTASEGQDSINNGFFHFPVLRFISFQPQLNQDLRSMNREAGSWARAQDKCDLGRFLSLPLGLQKIKSQQHDCNTSVAWFASNLEKPTQPGPVNAIMLEKKPWWFFHAWKH